MNTLDEESVDDVGNGNITRKKIKRNPNRLNSSNTWVREKLLNPYARKKLASMAAMGNGNQNKRNQGNETHTTDDNELMINRKRQKQGEQVADTTGGPFARNMIKFGKVLKYQMKKMKAKQMRQQQSRSAPKTHLIVIESSDEDDVVEVKLPSPPIVTVADSSDELNDEEECLSNVSDDFIGNADRFRLMQDDENIPENEVLNPTTDDTAENLSVPNDENIFVSPQKKSNKRRTTSSDYQVTQSNFRALDVYESESSDMPESVYAKGRTKGPSRASSSSDVEEINDIDEEIQKTKKFRKRRVSSNRGTEVTNDSTTTDEDDNEDDEDSRRGGLPFISRGEAVENCKLKIGGSGGKKRTKSLDKRTTDHEFVNILKNIAQGGQIDDDGNETDVSNKSEDEDDENITARKIAEDVISRRRGTQSAIVADQNEEELNNDDSVVTTKDLNVDNYLHESLVNKKKTSEDEEAIPHKINTKLDQVLDIIDKLQYTDNDDNDDEDIDVGNDEINFNVEEEVHCEDDDNDNDIVINAEHDSDMPNIAQSLDENSENSSSNFLKVIYSHSSKHIGWSDEMIRFYDYSWNGENFSVYETKRSMNANCKWTINHSDRYPKIKKYSKLKCYNCCEFGHIQMRCPKPKKDLVCYMCGEVGHKEPRCPNTICLRCGSKTRVFMKHCSSCAAQTKLMCPVCHIRGHSIDFCPDKWRRYHSTTIPNECPNKNVVYNKKKFCCICAGRGHEAENCRSALRFSQYPTVSSEIKSHAKSYKDVQITNAIAPNVIGYNLFYEPNERIKFDFSASNTIQQRQYYWRFLNAVGLRHLLTRKRETMKAIKGKEDYVEMEVRRNNEDEPKEKKSKTDNEQNTAAATAVDVPAGNNLSVAEKNILIRTSKLEDNKLKFMKSTANPLLRRVLTKNFERQNLNFDMPGNEVRNDETLEKAMPNVDENNVAPEQEPMMEMEFSEANEKVQTIEENASEEMMNEAEEGNGQETTSEEKDEEVVVDDVRTQETENVIFVDDSSNDCDMSESKDVEDTNDVIVIKMEQPSLEEKIKSDQDEVIICETNESEDNDTNYGDDDDDDEEDVDDEDDTASCAKSNDGTKENNKSAEPPADFLINVLIPNESSKNDEEVSQLPDFIPLSNTDDDCLTDDTCNNNPIGISHRLSGKNYEGECTNFIPDRDMPGAARIHLTNFHGKYLLSADGQKFLMEKCKKYNIKARISWTSQGNILIINGLPKERVRFHTDLLLTFRHVTETSYTWKVPIPRRRITLIKFIQREILQLKKDLGNVHSIYTQFSVRKIASSKESHKTMRKGRRLLNMILLGQIGLGDGRQHLRALTNLLRILQENSYERAPDDIQTEVYQHWKYIFSSQIHDNIHQLFKEYVQLKRQNRITKFNLVKVLGKNAIYVNFTKKIPNQMKQQQQLNAADEVSSSGQMLTGKKNDNLVFNPFSLYGGMIPGIIKTVDGNNSQGKENDQQPQQNNMDSATQENTTTTTSDAAVIPPNANKSSNNDSFDFITDDNSSSAANSAGQLKENFEINTRISEKGTAVTADPMKSVQEKSFASPSSFVSNKINEAKKIWEVQCENLLNKIVHNRSSNNDKRKSGETSVFWSREVLKFIDKCDAMDSVINTDVKMKLKKINELAEMGVLSHNHCILMTKVYNLIKAKAT